MNFILCIIKFIEFKPIITFKKFERHNCMRYRDIVDKNSSGDEIANVNFCYDDILWSYI